MISPRFAMVRATTPTVYELELVASFSKACLSHLGITGELQGCSGLPIPKQNYGNRGTLCSRVLELAAPLPTSMIR